MFKTSKFRITSLPAGDGANVGWDTGTNRLVDNTASSARYKENIEPLVTESGAALELEPRSFEYVESGDRDVGLIAEDVDEVLPQLVLEDDEGRPDGVRYDKLGVFLIPEIRENRERLADREEESEALRREVEALREENEQLRDRLAAIEADLGLGGGNEPAHADD